MSSQTRREAYEYAVRVCGRLGRRIQQMREGKSKSMYAVWQDSGVTRSMLSRVEAGESVFTLFALAQVVCSMGYKLEDFVPGLEDEEDDVKRPDSPKSSDLLD